jgi:uncharacterized protein YggE
MNKTFLNTLIILLSIAFLSTPVFALGAHENADSGISVTGTGTISLKPDTASISLAVVTRHAEAALSAQQNAELMTKVIDAVKKIGISDDDIATKNFSMYQESKYDRDGSVTSTVYRVTNTLNITVQDITTAGNVIDAALLAGANQLSSINYFVSDTTKAYTQARQLAVQQATDAAQTLAIAAGCKLGKPTAITEQSNSSAYKNDAEYEPAMMSSKSVMATPIAPGSTDITVNVNMRFTIK